MTALKTLCNHVIVRKVSSIIDFRVSVGGETPAPARSTHSPPFFLTLLYAIAAARQIHTTQWQHLSPASLPTGPSA